MESAHKTRGSLKQEDNPLNFIPAKVYGLVGNDLSIKEGLKFLCKRGANTSQQLQYIKVANQLKSTEVNLYLLNALISNRTFDPNSLDSDILPKINGICDKIKQCSGEYFDDVIYLYTVLSANGNFNIKMLFSSSFIKEFVDFSIEAVDNIDTISLQNLAGILNSEKFNPKFFEFLKKFPKIFEKNIDYAFSAIVNIFNNPRFNTGIFENNFLYRLSDVLKEFNFSYGSEYIAFELALQNQNFDFSKLNKDFGIRFSKICRLLDENDSNLHVESIGVLYRVLSDPDVNPHYLDESFAKNVISVTNLSHSLLGKASAVGLYLKKIVHSNSGLELYNILKKYDEGRKLAFSLGVYYPHEEVFFNFAYAIEKIGKEKTIAIYQEFGIEYFARYDPRMLEDLYKKAVGETVDQRPIMLVFVTKSDYNGAFYREREILNPPSKHYNVLVVEVANKKEIPQKAREIASKYGPIEVGLFSFHGNEFGFGVGNGPIKNENLTVLDEELIFAMRDYFLFMEMSLVSVLVMVQ